MSVESRSQRFIKALVTGYAAIAVNILCTLASVPLALHYLTKQEFGLWALLAQLTGYLMLLDLGMSGSINRFLCNYKDDINGGEYGSIILTGLGVFVSQGLVVMAVGSFVILFSGSLLGIPPHLGRIFIHLGLIQVFLCGMNLATRAFVSPLWAHQRLDISNLASIACQLSSLLVLWIGLHAGFHLYSLSIGAVLSLILSLSITVCSCIHLGLYPQIGRWGRLRLDLFRNMFRYGGGLLVLNLGSQLVSTSQIIIISRVLGLEAASVWAVSTKLATLVQQFVNRIFETSAARFAEMLVRDETIQLHRRLKDLIMLSSTLAGLGAIALVLFNQPFLMIWTSNKISWPSVNNSLLGIAVFFYCISRFHVGFASLSQNVHKIKFVILMEGLLFVGMAFPLCKSHGLTGILIASILANLVSTFSFSNFITARHLGLKKLAPLGWITRPAVLLFSFTLLAMFFVRHTTTGLPPTMESAAMICVYFLLILPIFLRIGLPAQLRTEIQRHFSNTFKLLTNRL
jgi:O-antigen/teichoic acid export membrane protein